MQRALRRLQFPRSVGGLFVLAAGVFVLTWTVFFVWIRLATLDGALVASWAQVATAFAFSGAGLVALLGVAEQLQPRRPNLQLDMIEMEDSAGVTRRAFELVNYGTETAERVTVHARLHAPKSVAVWADADLWRFAHYGRQKGRTVRPCRLFHSRPRVAKLFSESASNNDFRLFFTLRQPLPPDAAVIAFETVEEVPGQQLYATAHALNQNGPTQSGWKQDSADWTDRTPQ